MNQPRIAFLNASGQPGGGEVALAQLAKGVPNAKVILFESGPAIELLRSSGLDVEILPLSERVRSVTKEAGFEGPRVLWGVLSHAWSLSRRLREFDVVHCNNQKAWVIGAMASLLARKPVVWHLHDILSLEHFSRAKIRLGVRLSRFRDAKVVANSRASAEAFVAQGGRKGRLEVLYNPVDATPFREAKPIEGLREGLGIPAGEPVWGLFSRLASWKGQHIAIEALSRLAHGHLLLVGAPLFGEEPWEAKLRDQVRTLGLQQRVHFLGFRRDIPRLLASVDGAIHASTIAEPFGLVILEAQLAGKPVVATAAGGALEIVDPGTTGWLVPPADPHALGEVLSRWIQDPQGAMNVGARSARSAAEKFDSARLSERFVKILQEEAGR
ncbi:MAG TPA: glycosyltransferase family 4 protein [Fibrobacteria bacterium]|nr:glycosyltransferase family 4 protein [Fibrobacteria bacterium]